MQVEFISKIVRCIVLRMRSNAESLLLHGTKIQLIIGIKYIYYYY